MKEEELRKLLEYLVNRGFNDEQSLILLLWAIKTILEQTSLEK